LHIVGYFHNYITMHGSINIKIHITHTILQRQSPFRITVPLLSWTEVLCIYIGVANHSQPFRGSSRGDDPSRTIREPRKNTKPKTEYRHFYNVSVVSTLIYRIQLLNSFHNQHILWLVDNTCSGRKLSCARRNLTSLLLQSAFNHDAYRPNFDKG